MPCPKALVGERWQPCLLSPITQNSGASGMSGEDRPEGQAWAARTVGAAGLGGRHCPWVSLAGRGPTADMGAGPPHPLCLSGGTGQAKAKALSPPTLGQSRQKPQALTTMEPAFPVLGKLGLGGSASVQRGENTGREGSEKGPRLRKPGSPFRTGRCSEWSFSPSLSFNTFALSAYSVPGREGN